MSADRGIVTMVRFQRTPMYATHYDFPAPAWLVLVKFLLITRSFGQGYQRTYPLSVGRQATQFASLVFAGLVFAGLVFAPTESYLHNLICNDGVSRIPFRRCLTMQ